MIKKHCYYWGSFNTKAHGLAQMHKIHYLKWYCYLKNSNTF